MAEQRLIDANALIDWLTRATGFRTNCDDCTDIDCLNCIIEEAIKNAPTIEAKPVVHGRWEEASDGDGIVCPFCRTDFCTIIYDTEYFNYCPNCGAKMDGGIENG